VLDFDFGRNLWGLDRGRLVFKAGKYKVRRLESPYWPPPS
jgi:hypothetical protein